MTWKEEMILNLQSLVESVDKDKTILGVNVDMLEDNENARRKERNNLLQRVFKKVYGTLNDVDQKMMAGIKTDAYDTTRRLDKVQREVKKLLTDVEKAEESEEVGLNASVAQLYSKYSKVDVGAIISMCDVTLGYNAMELESVVLSAIFTLSGIYMKNASFDPKVFQVKVADSSLRERLILSDKEYAYFVVRSHNVDFPEGAVKNMKVQVFATRTHEEDIIPVMTTSIIEMKKNNQVVSDGINEIVFRVRRPSSLPKAVIIIKVSIFNSVLNGCPSFDTVGSGVDSLDLPNLTATAKLKMDESNYFDDLDEDDVRSLDMTNRRLVEQDLTNGSNESAMRITAMQSNGLLTGPPSTIMPITAALPHLAKVKQQEAAPTTPPPHRLAKPSAGTGTTKRVPNLSDVREVTREADVSIFSPVSDRGVVSTMRTTAMAGKLNGALLQARKAAEVIEEENGLDTSVVSCRKGLSVENMQKSLSSAECSREDEDPDFLLEGPEVQEIPAHNRSVSFAARTKIIQDLATPQVGDIHQRFRIEQGRTKVRDGQAGVAKILPQEHDEELDDIHLDLNASKAPSPTLADKSLPCDPAWNIGSGSVHEWAPSPLKGDQSFATKVGISDQSRMDMSVWEKEEQSAKELCGFNLALGLVEEVEIYIPCSVGEGKGCLQSPVHVEFAANFSKFLISEPEYNRIGVYSKGTVSFQGWFGGRSDPYEYPTNIIYLENGYIAVLESSKINIYDKDAKLIQKVSGRFNGLANAKGGDFISTQKIKDMKTHIAVIGQVNKEGEYIIKEKFVMSVISNNMKSKVRFLAVHAGKIYASDLGLDSIYVLDMQTRSQICWGLDCKEPCGMLVDDLGNVLVADSGNNRLVVFNGDGEFVREFCASGKGASSPSDMVKVRGEGKDGLEENHILVTYSGNDGTDGRVVRFKCT